MKYILLLICIFSTLCVSAQDKKKSGEKVPVYNYVLDDPMNQTYNQYTEKNRTFIYVPRFYSFKPIVVNDTTYTFECYDSRDSIMQQSKIQDITAVRFISEFKSFIDHAHTYRDADGSNKPLPVSSIICRYDRVGDNKWMCIDYATNKYSELKETRTYIVRTDTLTTKDSTTGDDLYTIHCYYKVDEMK